MLLPTMWLFVGRCTRGVVNCRDMGALCISLWVAFRKSRGIGREFHRVNTGTRRPAVVRMLGRPHIQLSSEWA